VVHKEFQD